MDEQNLFLKIIEERFDRFLDSYIVTGGDFLSPEEQSHAASFFRRNASQGAFLYGGYEEAERRMPVFMPDYTYVTDEDSLIRYFLEYPEQCPLRVLDIVIPPAEKTVPGHRDYLGALMGLGIKRTKIGDIIVGGAAAGGNTGMGADETHFYIIVGDVRVDLVCGTKRQERSEHLGKYRIAG